MQSIARPVLQLSRSPGTPITILRHPRAARIQARQARTTFPGSTALFRCTYPESSRASEAWTTRRRYSSGRLGLRDSHAKEEQGESEADELNGWDTIIGLEIHAQIKTGRKLFSSSRTSYDEEPNSNVVPYDAAFPGTLPVLNREAVKLTVATALALNCSVNPRSTFDRKHYFYHDIPASYQITQHYNPIATQGNIKLAAELDPTLDRDVTVRIQQIQIEQDTAKTTKMGDGRTHIDLNRAGMGLMEIVTEADMRSPKEAGAFIRKLQALLRRIGASDGDMEKGSLRVDANVSIHRPGMPFGTRCEIKNLNSVRFMMAALDNERRRHLQHYLSYPDTPVQQETRGFDEAKGETFTLRTKEQAEDYRYMPDGNLAPIIIKPAYLQQVTDSLPELPDDVRRRLPEQYGISLADTQVLLSMDDLNNTGVAFFEEVVQGINSTEAVLVTQAGKQAVNWIVNELLGRLAREEETWTASRVPAKVLGDLLRLINSGELTGTSAKNVLRELLGQSAIEPDTDVKEVASQMGLIAISQSAQHELRALCEAVIAKLPAQADSVRKGKDRVVMRLVGQVMKDSNGKADAKKARELLLSILSMQSS